MVVCPMASLRRIVPLFLLVTACSSTPANVTETDGSSSGTGSSTATPEGSSTAAADASTGSSGVAPTTGPDETGESSTAGTTVAPDPICGNGFVEGDEPCDDGNSEVDDGCNSKCQRTGVPIWTQSWDSGGKKDDYAEAVAMDAEGNIYIAGLAITADFQRDALVRKLDPEGKELLKFTYAGQLALEDDALAIAVGDDGSIYVVGGEQIAADGPFQAWARKYDAKGKEQWAFVRASALPDVGSSFMNGVAVDDQGAVYVAGRESDTEKSIFKAYLMRLDGSDTPVWTVETPAAGGTAHSGVAITPEGDIVHATALRNDKKKFSALVGKYDANGKKVWSKTYLDEEGYALAVSVAADGTIAVSGLSLNVNDADMWIAKLDADGGLLWTDKYDGEVGGDVGWAVGHSAAGDIYLGGDVTVNGQQQNVMVRRYTSDGELYWFSTYNDEENLYDNVAGLAVGSDRMVVVGVDFVLGSGSNHWLRAYQL